MSQNPTEMTMMKEAEILNFVTGAIERNLRKLGKDARVKVKTRTGYISYHNTDVGRAYEVWEQEGLPLNAIYLQESIFDDGEPLFGDAVADA